MKYSNIFQQPHSRDVIQEESDVNNQMRFWQLHRSLCNEHFKRRNVSINLPLHSRLRCNSNRPMDTVRPSYSGYQKMQDRGISEHQMTTGEGQSVPHPNTFYDFQDISRGPYPQNMKIFQQMPPVGSELQKAASNQENLLYQHFHEINLHGLPDLNANENLQAGHASECCPVARDMLSKYICNLQAALREVETGESYQQPTGAIQHPPSRLQDYERHNDFLTLQSTESVQNQDDPLEIDGIYLCRNEQGELEALVDVEAYCENISDDLEILDDDIMQEIIANNSCSEAENYVKQTKVYCDTVAQNLFHSTCFDLLFQKCQEPLTVDTRGHEYNLERNLGRPYYSDVPVLIRYDQAQNMQPEVYQNAQLPQYDDQPSQSADGTNTVSAEDLESSILDSGCISSMILIFF